LRTDTNGDGIEDMTLMLFGDYRLDGFQVTPRDAGTAITYVPNQPPVAGDDTVDTAFETALVIAVLANDTDPDGTLEPATVTIVTPPALGTAAVNEDGTITYTPNAGASGDDSFTYSVADNDGAVSNAATVAVSIAAPEVEEPLNVIMGTARNNKLVGTGGNDLIWGLAGNDWLEGKDGDDILIGGKGADGLTGGRGADLFVIDALSLIPDTVFDFTPSEGDRLSLGPLIDSLGLREGEQDLDALVGVTRLGKNLTITLDTEPRREFRRLQLLSRMEPS
jgi:Ca2+-binding RTX toxin-like protein